MTLALSRFEQEDIAAGVAANLRSDGRLRTDYRPFTVESGIVSNTSGSARVRLGLTDVLVGVKAEIGEPDQAKPTQGRFEVTVDFSSTSASAAAFDDDNTETELASAIARTLKGVDLSALCIVPGEQCWVIYIDALILVAAGNAYDVLSLAVRAALANTRIPKVEVSDDGHGRVELEVSDDPHHVTELDIRAVPVIVTLSKIGAFHIVDATIEEESCAKSRVHVAVDSKGAFCMVTKASAGGIEPQLLFDALESAKQVGQHLLSQLEATLKQEERALAMFPNSQRGFLTDLQSAT
ncbi:exosome component 7 [Capsaspora owczarzaki ATCC 30864]|uniref:Ribosomal RNA-processing protein 42 n=1 Tax=Capsaspora owczarzaki (strain ATCC 30864) TaxID=595528 RepID=A0A0D2WQ15_CAPO3|nr:exosome component 7 [Capsaspora owczarzaki ATCC 30864]KJE93625.1 exosome component 7 [Capsaspora owczarzaki ATCC 30864]|eukprot:XP_004348212.1 exosome component 7 [Capsaspora owczarzaki ATCC 30864]